MVVLLITGIQTIYLPLESCWTSCWRCKYWPLFEGLTRVSSTCTGENKISRPLTRCGYPNLPVRSEKLNHGPCEDDQR